MARLALLAVLFAAAACAAAAQPATAEAAPENPPGVGIKVSFRPSVVIVVGIFTMIFSLTFILLMYAKFCHPSSSSSALPNAPPVANVPRRGNEATQQAGVPKPVVESLPFFRFATLRGARQGMECSVCLACFDDADLLRLLPRCRHAFHLDCVDRWLESNASCPLCRTRVDAEAAALGLKYPSSARIVFGGDGLSNSDRFSGYTAGSGRDLLDIFVERVPSSRFLGSKAADEEEEPPHMVSPPELDRHKHRIIVSDVVFKSRWSELNSADLIALDTEMLRSMSSGRFFQSPEAEYNDEAKLSAAAEEVDHVVLSIREETEKKLLLGSKQGTTASSGGVSRGVGCSNSAAVDAVSAYAAARMISSGVRSMSEIVSVPRRRERLVEEGDRRWLPIARRTARWFAGRANGEEEGSVHVVAAHV